MLSILLVYYLIPLTHCLRCPLLELSIPPPSPLISTIILTQIEPFTWENQQLLLRLSQTEEKWSIHDPTGLIFESEQSVKKKNRFCQKKRIFFLRTFLGRYQAGLVFWRIGMLILKLIAYCKKLITEAKIEETYVTFSLFLPHMT